eukprot:Gb_10833 [translate_table: standard]
MKWVIGMDDVYGVSALLFRHDPPNSAHPLPRTKIKELRSPPKLLCHHGHMLFGATDSLQGKNIFHECQQVEAWASRPHVEEPGLGQLTIDAVHQLEKEKQRKGARVNRGANMIRQCAIKVPYGDTRMRHCATVAGSMKGANWANGIKREASQVTIDTIH